MSTADSVNPSQVAPSQVTPSRAKPSQTVLRLQWAFRTALSMGLIYWLALWLNWDMPKYGALAIALISLDTTGASLRKGMLRIVGTTIGLAVGMMGLALFAQDSLLTLLYFASYLVVIGYLMQTSRYPYAYYVAGFLPTLVWATTYGKVDNAFDYATFRYLETTAGIIIYTAASIIFWPRRARDELKGQGHDLWRGLQDLFGMYRRQLNDGQLPSDARGLQAKVAGATSQMLATLDAAYTETPSIASKKRAWESIGVYARAVGDAMELWRHSIDDCRRLDVQRLLPQVHRAMETMDQRLSRIDDLWRVVCAGEESTNSNGDADALRDSLQLELNRELIADLSHLDRGALLAFVRQLNVLDVASRELLRTMRVLAGVASVRDLESHALPADLYRPSRWDPMRLINGSLPAACLIVGYVFWIYFDPPTGPSVPNMAATFALLVLLTPMRILKMLPAWMIVIWGMIAPIYFLVMPRLSTGVELFAVVFCFTFACRLLTGRLAPLGTIGMVLFTMMTGISNQQSYSFMGLVDGTFMVTLSLAIVAVMQALLSPARPEQVLLSSVRRLFRGCARVMGGLSLDSSSDQTKGRRLRKRYTESMVLPAPAQILRAAKHLDYKLYPGNSPDKVERLHDSLQSIAYRLRSLEIAHDRVTLHSFAFPDSFLSVTRRAQEATQTAFDRWASFEPLDARISQTLQPLARDVERQFDALAASADRGRIDDTLSADLYSLLGCFRGLAEAMAEAQDAMSRLDFQQLAAARF